MKHIPSEKIPVSSLIKTVKASSCSSCLLDMKLSWQVNEIDFDGPFGWYSNFEGIEVEIDENQLLKSLDSLEPSIADNFFNDLESLIGNKFRCIKDLINKITDLSPDIPISFISHLLNNLKKEAFFNDVYKKFSEFENKSWKEVFMGESARQNHSISTSMLEVEAQKRLRKIKKEDIDKLYSIRITKKKRVWGIKRNHVFSVLWYDPNHKVYISKRYR